MNHIPVLLKEVLRYLDPKPEENFIDCTIGFGGHTLAILKKNKPKGKVLGIEWDKTALEQLQTLFGAAPRLILIQENFAGLKKIVKQLDVSKYQNIKFHGVLFDLGLSSWQIEKSGRGFSFLKDEPLDMRFGDNRLKAGEIINQRPKKELEIIFREYGGERYAGRIAEKIARERQKQKIATTGQLVEVIRQAVPRPCLYNRIHFATRVFQALRITVNDELNNLSQALTQALEIIEPTGRIVVISFHSLEDRLVKNFFREQAKNGNLKILTKKPTRPSREEIKLNPRSRSARLRAAVKTI